MVSQPAVRRRPTRRRPAGRQGTGRDRWGIGRRLRAWPLVVSLAMAMLPVAALSLVVINLALESRMAVVGLGLGHLFSTEFSGAYTSAKGLYGLLPAMWGSFLMVTIGVSVALPVSVAMGIFATEYSLSSLGKAMGTLLGGLSGIPPIVYGLTSVVFAELVLGPKFASLTLDEIRLLPGYPTTNPGVLPTGPSTLLGGFVVSLLVIPFMAPLVADAIANVPNELKEASLALGANRWHTLIKVILPYAMPGIVAAISLGTLKAAGDVMIAIYAVGLESGLPDPLFDVLERTAPLPSTGAGLMGTLTSGGGYKPLDGSVAYFAGLLLLVLAFAILLLAGWLQKRLTVRHAR